ncbi:MAG TPA: 4-hydroxy-3-methylbut-2-enyl diphosphate reductase [candidate division Zixibacteria bacterium]|jgi:4-hydroxy-3-methylbut-2-enyl diphosphate reductase|nr:4-hydroxy-3-methylbut-2-enyl diphosphate reductase [candidate division Zixibacteria bacterium]
MKIEVAKRAGFCFGVKRAVKMAFEAAESSSHPVHTLGPIIHNPQVVEELDRRGVRVLDRPSDVRSGTVIIRSHGVHPKVLAELKARKVRVIDATCPFVTKAQRAASTLRREGRQVVIVGEREHPEVTALRGYAGGDAVIYSSRNRVRLKPKVGALAQTTLSSEVFSQALCSLAARTPDLHVFNTICQATQIRQQDTMELAKRSDVMVVVGGRNSANTSRLVELCRKVGRPTHHVETEEELQAGWFRRADSAGVTAGASTPEATVRQVVKRMRQLTKTNRNQENEKH